jgi:hypothetical protein
MPRCLEEQRLGDENLFWGYASIFNQILKKCFIHIEKYKFIT